MHYRQWKKAARTRDTAPTQGACGERTTPSKERLSTIMSRYTGNECTCHSRRRLSNKITSPQSPGQQVPFSIIMRLICITRHLVSHPNAFLRAMHPSPQANFMLLQVALRCAWRLLRPLPAPSTTTNLNFSFAPAASNILNILNTFDEVPCLRPETLSHPSSTTFNLTPCKPLTGWKILHLLCHGRHL